MIIGGRCFLFLEAGIATASNQYGGGCFARLRKSNMKNIKNKVDRPVEPIHGPAEPIHVAPPPLAGSLRRRRRRP